MKRKITPFIDEHPYLFGAIILGLLTFLMYGDVIFGPSNVVLSRPGTDLTVGFYNIQFYSSNLRHGLLPLWNPHMLSGYPWFASFQSLLLYPFAWTFLILSPGKGINIFIALHVFLLGFGMFCWLKQRHLHPLSCILGAALLMFGSTVTMQIYAGHITPLASMTWAPWILLAVDCCFDSPKRLQWILAGTGFVALQIMGGFPQHVYYTALVVGIYTIIRTWQMASPSLQDRFKAPFSIFLFYAWGTILCAIQLLTTFDAAAETARHGKLPFSFAGSFSFPPLNFLTLLTPKVLGDDVHLPYWGHWYIWEMILFIGIIGLILCVYGFWTSARKEKCLLGILSLLTCLIALGFYTPFYSFLYHFIPGFGSFRANSRILFQLSVFLTALAATGYHRLLQNRYNRAAANISFIVAGFLGILTCVTFWQQKSPSAHLIKVLLRNISQTPKQYIDPQFYVDPSSAHAIVSFVAPQFAFAAIIALIVGSLFLCSAKSKRFIYYVGLIAVAEILFFTATMRPTFPLQMAQHPAYKAFLEKHPGDARFVQFDLNTWANGLPLSLSGGNIGGYESFRLQRYDSFIQFAQGKSPNIVYSSLDLKKAEPIFGILRCKYIFEDGKVKTLNYNILPHLLIVPQWTALNQKGKVLSRLNQPGFNPRKTVLLESTPHFPPTSKVPAKEDQATLIKQTPNWLDIKATTSKNAILLVTDAYAKGWKVFPYADSVQQKYDVLPADYILRGIPLSPGTHHFRLQYAPDAFYRGRTISLIALVFYLLAWCAIWGSERRRKRCNNESI